MSQAVLLLGISLADLRRQSCALFRGEYVQTIFIDRGNRCGRDGRAFLCCHWYWAAASAGVAGRRRRSAKSAASLFETGRTGEELSGSIRYLQRHCCAALFAGARKSTRPGKDVGVRFRPGSTQCKAPNVTGRRDHEKRYRREA
jgi:hypothetical protein